MAYEGDFPEVLPVKVINIDTKEIIVRYPSIAKACLYLGLGDKVIRTMLSKRTRAYSPMLKRIVAVRIDKPQTK